MIRTPTISGSIRNKYLFLIIGILASSSLGWADGESAQVLSNPVPAESSPQVLESRIRSYVLLYYSEIRNEAHLGTGPYLQSLFRELALYTQDPPLLEPVRTHLAQCETPNDMYRVVLEWFPEIEE